MAGPDLQSNNGYSFIFQTIEGKDNEINTLKEEKSKIEKEFDSCKSSVSWE